MQDFNKDGQGHGTALTVGMMELARTSDGITQTVFLSKVMQR